VTGKKNSQEPVLTLLVSRLESFERAILGMDTKVNDLVIITAKQEENVKEHMRRSDALERKQDRSEQDNVKRDELLSQRLAPIENHVKWVGTTFKVMGVIGGIIISSFTLLKLYLEISKLLS